MPKKKAAPAKEETTDKKTKTGPTPAEKLADELDDLMIAYLKACRETPDKAPGLEKKMKAKTAQLAALGSRDRRAPELGRRRVMRLRCSRTCGAAVTAVRSRGSRRRRGGRRRHRARPRHRRSRPSSERRGDAARPPVLVRPRAAPPRRLSMRQRASSQRGLRRRRRFFGQTWCHLLRDDIITLAERRLLGRNATHLVRRGATHFVKNNIFETEIGAHEEARDAAPHLATLYADRTLRDRLRECVGGPLRSQSFKVQLNHGNGGCFPLHFDGDPSLDDRVITAVLYLNPDWSESHGGHLQLVPFPERPVDVAPLFDRLVLFASHDTLHRALPSQNVRFCVTLWFYRTAPGGGAALDDDAKAERRLMARYASGGGGRGPSARATRRARRSTPLWTHARHGSPGRSAKATRRRFGGVGCV